jgi:hypothetical protein
MQHRFGFSDFFSRAMGSLDKIGNPRRHVMQAQVALIFGGLVKANKAFIQEFQGEMLLGNGQSSTDLGDKLETVWWYTKF